MRNEFSIRFLAPAHQSVSRCAVMGRYLAEALRQTALNEQVWVVSVDDEGTPNGRVRCHPGQLGESSIYLRPLLQAMLRTNTTQFVVVHYGVGDAAARELAALLACKMLRRLEAMAGFSLLDYILADNLNGNVVFRSLNDDG